MVSARLQSMVGGFVRFLNGMNLGVRLRVLAFLIEELLEGVFQGFLGTGRIFGGPNSKRGKGDGCFL